MVRLHVGDELLQVVCRQAVGRHQHDRHFDNQRNRLEVVARVVKRGFVERLVLCMGPDRTQQHLIAVRLRIRDARGTNHAARARNILDHHGLPKRRAKACSQNPARDIRATARAERHHHIDLAARPFLRDGSIRERRYKEGWQQVLDVVELHHEYLPFGNIVRRY